MPAKEAARIEIRWLGISESKGLPKVYHLKTDFVKVEDKIQIQTFLQNLAQFNKNQRPPTIYAEDLTKEQIETKKKKFAQKKTKKS
uniref:Uncharacterized protein n=1 Tax=Romanomermis culicivorax TaxID=13658 RepID=A0A915KJ03_ROMCU